VGGSYDQDIQLNRNRPPRTSVLRKMSDAPGRNLTSFFKWKPQVTEADKARLHAEGQARRDAQAAEETARRHAVDMLLRSWHVPQEPIQKKGRMGGPHRWILGLHRMARAIVAQEMELPTQVFTSVPDSTKLYALEADEDYVTKYHKLCDQAAVESDTEVAGMLADHAQL
jgi:hypothetical protein